MKKYNCEGCPIETQKARRCHSKKWEQEVNTIFPVKLLEYGSDHMFCPGRVFRDDPEFAHQMRINWLGWKLHQVPSGDTIGNISPDDSDILSTMIFRWEELTRVRDFHVLGQMLGGKKEGK